MEAPPNRDALIQQFCAFTGSSPADAEPILASHEWNVESAVATWFASQEGNNEDEVEEAGSDAGMDEPPAATQPQQPAGLVMGGGRTLGGAPAPSASSSSSRPSSAPKANRGTQRGGPKTLKDLQGDGGHEAHGHAHGDDDDSEEEQDFFAGGEKSGLAVQNPNANPSSSARDHINSILERAKRGGTRHPENEPQPASRFSGRGVTLGGDDAPSQVIEDPNAVAQGPPRLPRVRRVLHLWLEGFSVDDGPLLRYDDPANAQTLEMINQGRAPLSLLNVAPGQEVNLELDDQKKNPFVQPKKKYVPFGGSGQRLGSPSPGASFSAPPSQPAVAAAAPTASSGTVAGPSIDVSDAQPTVTLQIRLGDGTRLQSRFNTSHTISDVYGFVDAARPDSRSYVLMTTFPSKDLDDKSVQLGDMPEFKRGGVVVQKWK